MHVEVHNLVRRYGWKTALNGVTFTLNSGGITAFVGANGAGKSTTLRLMAGRETPDEGDILIDGISLLASPERLLSRIGFMPDAIDPACRYRVIDYLDFGARIAGLTGESRRRKLQELIDFTGIAEYQNRYIPGLSKGMRQRVSLARMLIADPELLLLDEPAAGLDPKARLDLRDMLLALGRKKKTVFLSSHILSELDEMCDSAILIDNGRIVKDSAAPEQEESGGVYLLKFAGSAAEYCEAVAAFPIVVSAAEAGERRLRVRLIPGERTAEHLVTAVFRAGMPLTGFEDASEKLERLFADDIAKEVHHV